METELAWRTAAALTGLLGGAVGAWFSVALPAGAGERAAPSGRRLAGFAAAGLLAGVWAGQLTPGPLGVLTSALGAALLLVAVVDGEHLWLPRVLTVPLGLAGIASALVIDTAEALDRIAGAAAGFAVLALLSWAYRALRGREGLGGGDAWLLGAL
ncbi:MAG TPA: prepilin peptidase, partial [Caulobacteraceae bacterium]|nr:prepilin peptidase [Caulobacteraceae bacterium]